MSWLSKSFKKISKAFKKAVGLKARSKAASSAAAQTTEPVLEDTSRSGGEGTFSYKTESR